MFDALIMLNYNLLSMAQSTIMRDLVAKIDTILVMMNERRERMMPAIYKKDERVKMLEQSLRNITTYIKMH